MPTPRRVHDLPTPALVVDAQAFEHNLATMASARPGTSLRPHVKAHKCTEIAKRQIAYGHTTFCAATTREIIGLADAGITDDLLLANECVDAVRLRMMAVLDANVTVAVDSDATIAIAARNGIRNVLIDVNVGLPRCGCAPDDAGHLADAARRAGMEVRGVMGYEGHVVGLADEADRRLKCEAAMALLERAHALAGGDIISAGGTGTYAINEYANEIQAGSYALMDTAYGALGLPFLPSLRLVTTVVSVGTGYAVIDCGLKSLGMDHGNPLVEHGKVWFCSDEHTTFEPAEPVHVGDRVLVQPAHVDPTVAYHDRIHVAAGPDLDAELLDEWAVDLRGW